MRYLPSLPNPGRLLPSLGRLNLAQLRHNLLYK